VTSSDICGGYSGSGADSYPSLCSFSLLVIILPLPNPIAVAKQHSITSSVFKGGGGEVSLTQDLIGHRIRKFLFYIQIWPLTVDVELHVVP
jgi:hypothetical protein